MQPCSHAAMQPCSHAAMQPCMHACMRACMHAHAYTHTRIHAYTHTCIRAYTHTRIHAYMHNYTHTACLHLHLYSHAHAQVRTRKCARALTRACAEAVGQALDTLDAFARGRATRQQAVGESDRAPTRKATVLCFSVLGSFCLFIDIFMFFFTLVFFHFQIAEGSDRTKF